MSHPVIEGFRLSPQQKQLWLQQNSQVNAVAQMAILLTGKLHLEFLQTAIQNIVNRHEILRTTFHSLPGVKTPIQVIQDNQIPAWKTLNLQQYQFDEQLKVIEEYLIEQRRLINNLSNSSPLQIRLLILSQEQHLLVLTLPALYADGSTLNNLFSEISQTYYLCLENQDLQAVFEEPIQYIQFSEWQNQLLEEEEAKTGQEFWQQQDFITQSPLILPLENSQIGENRPLFSIESKAISPELTAKIAEFATQYQTTTPNVLLTCWQTLLWRLTQQSNFITYAILNDRKYEELQELMGLAAKSLPVPCVLQQNFEFLEVLNQVTEKSNQIQKWQEYYVEPENIGKTEKIGFEFQELPDDHLVGNLSFSIYYHFCCFSAFKLKLNCLQHKSEIRLELHFEQHRFDLNLIQQLFNNFITLVNDAVNRPNVTIAELEILNSQQQHQLLIEFNNTQKLYQTPDGIHQLFEQQVEKNPDKLAVVFADETLTYSQLNTKANQLAHSLIKLGVGADVLVGLYVERSLDAIVGILGILKAGAAYLPLDTKLPPENLAFRLQDTKTTIVLTQQSLTAIIPNSISHIICLDTDWNKIAQESQETPKLAVKPEHLVYAIFTSGSTGKPKAVAIEHQQILNYVYGILDRISFPPNASFATVSTFAADLGNTMIFAALCTGGCLHILPQETVADAQAIASYFQQKTIDCLKIVPSHLNALLTAYPHPSILPRQCLILGGETSHWELIQTLQKIAQNCQIFNHYGPTETTVGVLTYPVKIPHPQAQTVPLGKPLPNTQMFVLDSLLKPVPIGVPGELYIGGSSLARGYLNRHELTQEKFIQNHFSNAGLLTDKLYKTGDLVRYLPDGNLEFLGRVDHQIKIRGFRIELGEIETTLQQHPKVQTAVVLPETNQDLVAYIVPSFAFVYNPKQQSEFINQLRDFCLQKLPDYMLPSAFVLLKALPLTPNGKVDRQTLSKLEKTRPEINQTSTPPRTPVEKQLAEIWQQLLKLEQIGIEDNFFDLGGHSLLVTQLLAKVRKAFKINLDLRELFNAPTIAELAQIIEGKTINSIVEKSSVNLLEEAVLDPTITPQTPVQYPNNPQSILLTGATGFLGTFLLKELLKQTTANIYCLVRSKDKLSGEERLIQSLKFYQIWDEQFSSRIIPILGNLAQPLLGLSEEQFQILANQIDVIYHNGAWVNFTYPYSVLKPANVLGTQEVLRLATQIKVKPVHFISTIGVAKILGQFDLNNKSDQGYTESKWVAEKLVKIAGERGVPISIYRPGRISGDSQTGVCNPEDHTFRMIRGCIQLGSVPQQNVSVNLTPVDYASQAIVHLSQQQSSFGQIFDILNPQSIPWNDLADLITDLGYPLQKIPYEQWRQKLIQISETETDHALYPLIGIFSEVSEESEPLTSDSYSSNPHTNLADLASSGITCPPVNRQLLEAYFSYLVGSGFLSYAVSC